MANLRDRFLKDNPFLVVVIAMAVLIVGELLLAWQYRQLEEGRLSKLEERVEEQAQTIEEQAARSALREFFEARVAGNQERASSYITEETALQMQLGAFEFSGVQNYTVESIKQLGEGSFQFQVELTRDRLEQIELIEVRKFNNTYFVNSVQPAG